MKENLEELLIAIETEEQQIAALKERGWDDTYLRSRAEHVRYLKNAAQRRAALRSGVADQCYTTPGWGAIYSYHGRVMTALPWGKFTAIGHPVEGTPTWVARQGYLEFLPVD